jgi:hypothetical protein
VTFGSAEGGESGIKPGRIGNDAKRSSFPCRLSVAVGMGWQQRLFGRVRTIFSSVMPPETNVAVLEITFADRFAVHDACIAAAEIMR